MMLARPFRPLVAVAAVVLLGAGCASRTAGNGTPAAQLETTPAASADNGIARLSAGAILAKAQAALASAKSFRVRLHAPSTGQGISFDIRYAGVNAIGTLSVASGQTLELRRLGQIVYLKGNRRFWSANLGEAPATLLTGKWLKTSMNDKRFGRMSELLDASKGDFLHPDGQIAKSGRKTVRGTPAVGLVDRSDGSLLYIATVGPPYPLQTVPKTGAGDGSVDFLAYGRPVSVPVPPADLIIDTSKLPGS
jgi:hypothetical protein